MSIYTGDTSAGAIVVSTALPNDGSNPDAADVNVPLEQTFDNFAIIKAQFNGHYLLVGRVEQAYILEDNPAFSRSFTTTAYVSTENEAEFSLTIPSAINGVQDGDLVVVTFSGAVSISTAGTGDGWIRMVGKEKGGSYAFNYGGCAHRAERACAGLRLPITFCGSTILTHSGSMTIHFEGKVTNVNSTLKLHAPYRLEALIYRKSTL